MNSARNHLLDEMPATRDVLKKIHKLYTSLESSAFVDHWQLTICVLCDHQARECYEFSDLAYVPWMYIQEKPPNLFAPGTTEH